MWFCNTIHFCDSTRSWENEQCGRLSIKTRSSPEWKINLNLREDLTVKPAEVNIEWTSIAPEEPVYKNDDNLTENPEQEIWQRKAEVRNTTSSQPPVFTVAAYYHIDSPVEPSILDMAHFNKPSRILIEWDSDPTLLNFIQKTLGLPFDDQVLINDARYMHYSRNRKRIILKDDIFYTQ